MEKFNWNVIYLWQEDFNTLHITMPKKVLKEMI